MRILAQQLVELTTTALARAGHIAGFHAPTVMRLPPSGETDRQIAIFAGGDAHLAQWFDPDRLLADDRQPRTVRKSD